MDDHVWNFSAGPATLPARVLERAAAGVIELDGSGMSILEVSHRSSWFEAVIREAEAGIRELLSVPETHRILFCQGGASLQFSMSAMNLLRGREQPADYVITGSWGKKAAAQARREGAVRLAWDGEGEGFVRAPGAEELQGLGRAAAYVHFTSNETIQGVEWPITPDVAAGAPLVCDMSSDFLSRPVDVGRYGLIYAGAQKNAGPAGVTVVIAHDDVIAAAPDDLPAMLDYRTYAEHGSLYNTPPTFAIFVVMLVTRWLRDEIGGLEKMAAINEEKAAILYQAIDTSEGFYAGHARPESRSRMNVTWRLASEELEREFLAGASERGLLELRGHRSVGGIRASIYNGMPIDAVRVLREFMDEFLTRTS